LFDGFDTLIIVDCVERGAAPGSLFLLEVHVPPIDAIPATQRLTMSTDMHRAGPDRALLVARAAGVLPSRVWLVGCQPGETEEFSTDLSPAVRDALPAAVNAIRGLIGSLSSSVAHHAGR
jgi:hydrogenase maturation protease